MTETPKYTVISKKGELELRRYPAMIQAEVDVQAQNHRNASYKGFSVLAAYIFGENTAQKQVAMTSPVQVGQSQKIAMTSPVTVRGKGTYTVAFIMPAEFTLESLPTPKHSGIRFNSLPARVVAALRYPGYFRSASVKKAASKLYALLKAQGLTPIGDNVVAAYNPPWVPWFLARNEILVEVSQSGGQP